jgi:hypothetical protein
MSLNFLACKEGEKERQKILLFAAFFNRHFRVPVLLFEYFFRVVRYYCPSLITAFHLSVLSQTLSAELPSNDNSSNNKKRHQSKTSSHENGGELKKKLFTCSVLGDLLKNHLK